MVKGRGEEGVRRFCVHTLFSLSKSWKVERREGEKAMERDGLLGSHERLCRLEIDLQSSILSSVLFFSSRRLWC